MENKNVNINGQYDEDTIDLVELFNFYLSKIWFFIATFMIGGVVAFLVTWQLMTPVYTATAKMYMVSSSSGSVVDLTDLNIGTSLSTDYVELIKTRPIFEDVIETLKLEYDYEELEKMVEIGTIGDTRILTIACTSEDPEEARDVANELATAAKKTLPKLMDTPQPSIAEKAITPEKKSSPSITKNTMLGAIGLAALTGVIFTIMFLLDDTLKTAEDVEKEFGIMPMTVIPEGELPGFTEKDEKKKRREKLKERHKRHKKKKREKGK